MSILDNINAFALPFAFLSGHYGIGFGSGFGISSPYFNSKFFWLASVKNGERSKRAWYQWLGGFGAQIVSYEFQKPKPGERRFLFGHEFQIFQTPKRRGLVVRTSWYCTDLKPNCGYEDIRALQQELENWQI